MTRFLPVVWPIIHPDVMTTFNTLWHLDSRNLRNINDARIVLQPKSAEVASVRYYHPISLIHIFGKLFSKVLANRLAQKLGELVQANQSAFIKGRLIQDNFKLVQLLAKLLHAQRKESPLLKFDIA
jgi:hypothetical protein